MRELRIYIRKQKEANGCCGSKTFHAYKLSSTIKTNDYGIALIINFIFCYTAIGARIEGYGV